MRQVNWERLAAIAICAAAAAAIGWMLGELLGCALPFLLAWGLSLCIRPAAGAISKRFRVSRGFCSVVLFTVALGAVIALLWAAVLRLLGELEVLLARLTEQSENGIDYYGLLAERFAFLRRSEDPVREAALRERVNQAVGRWVSGFSESLGKGVPALAAGLISSAPSALLFAATAVISGYYFLLDGERIGAGLRALLPAGLRRRLPAWRERVRRFSGRYLRAYLLLLLLTLGELLVGFLLLGVDYALLLATVTAAVDLLPILGVGTVLIPWSIVSLLQRDYRLGIGLLLLYLAVMLIRQIVEPRLLGKSLGLHPLAVLAAGYAGFRLIGIAGLLLAPAAVLALRQLLPVAREEKA